MSLKVVNTPQSVPVPVIPVSREQNHFIATAPSVPRIALIGVPNTGKSLLFHRLTGKFSTTANAPYTTSQLEEATIHLGGQPVILVDTPGITGLEFCSEDEAPTRVLLQQHPPDTIIQCVDAGNLVRSLVLTAQLAELKIPIIICLTMVDEALGRGIMIDAEALFHELNVPVISICPRDGRGVRKLTTSITHARTVKEVSYPKCLLTKLTKQSSLPPASITASKVISNQNPTNVPSKLIACHALLEFQHHWAKNLAEKVSRSTDLEPRHSFWDTLAATALHPWGAWVVLILTTLGMYLLITQVGIKLLATSIENYFVQPAIKLISDWIGAGFWQDLLVGPYGLLSLGLFNALGTVLPILSVFYFMLSFMEDVGFFPILAVQFDRLFRWIGLTGKAVFPLSLGFGCSSVATLATRCLESPRQRFIACFLIALSIPCAPQMGVMISILCMIPPVAILGLLLTAILLTVIVGNALAHIWPQREQGEFLMEIPPFRRPLGRNILEKTYYRLKDFIYEACPMFVASAGFLFILHSTGLLEKLRNFMAPVVTKGLGLPREGAEMLLMTLARREIGAVMMKEMVDKGELNLKQIFIGLLVMTLFIPCMSNTLLLYRVVGGLKTVIIFLSVLLIAFGLGFSINMIWR